MSELDELRSQMVGLRHEVEFQKNRADKLADALDMVVDTTREVVKNGYTIIETHRVEYAILCHRCGRISHHPEDVKNKYCGQCHLFHEDQGVTP